MPANREQLTRLHEQLRHDLGVVMCAALADPFVTGIKVSEDGKLWLKKHVTGWEDTLILITVDQRVRALNTMASLLGKTLNGREPLLSGELPLTGDRVQGSVPPSSLPSFIIRIHAPRVFPFEDYVAKGILQAWQAEVLREHVQQRSNIVFSGAVDSGKALDIDTRVLTPTGYSFLKDLQVGDAVVGSDGLTTRITGVFPQGIQPAYKVIFRDKSEVICSEDHLWQVMDRGENCNKRVPCILSTAEIRARLQKNPRRRFYIPTIKPIQFQQQELPLDPYLLGLLIGDGNCHDGTIKFTKGDAEIITALRALLRPLGVEAIQFTPIDYRLRQINKDGHHKRVNPLTQKMRVLGLAVRSWEKFIPSIYKYAHMEARIAVVQGLLDTDGSADPYGFEFSTSSQQLAKDFIFLVQSLGGIIGWSQKQGAYTKNGVKTPCRISYRVLGSLPSNIAPFRLARKANRLATERRQPRRTITSIEPVGVREMLCISVNAPDGLFAIEQCLLTHNTTLLNTALQLVSPTEHIFIVEDTREIETNAPNVTRMQTNESHLTMRAQIKASLRWDPDRLIIGETRDVAGFELLKSWILGKRGGMTTVHADSAPHVFDRFAQFCEEAGVPPQWRLMRAAIDLICHMAMTPHGRRVTEMLAVRKEDEGEAMPVHLERLGPPHAMK